MASKILKQHNIFMSLDQLKIQAFIQTPIKYINIIQAMANTLP